MSNDDDEIGAISDLKGYYQGLFQKHKNSPEAVQHVSQEGQYRRFDILTEGLPSDASILDLGCGLGHMADYLNRQARSARYLGLDFTPDFIAEAKDNFAEYDNIEFAEHDMLEDAIPLGYDYILISGVFNNRLPGSENETFLFNTIEKAFFAAGSGIRFNALSSYVDYHDPLLFYVDPMKVFDFIKRNVTPYVLLQHDYVLRQQGFPYEFTMQLSKMPRLAGDY